MTVCVAIIAKADNRFVAVRSCKGRGITLPGGKVNEGETIFDAAKREFREETSLRANELTCVFNGMNTDGNYVYVFTATIDFFHEFTSTEGDTMLATKSELLGSVYKPFYEILDDYELLS